MSYTRGPESALSSEGPSSTDSARPGHLVNSSPHYRAAREAPRDFGLLAGNVTGAHVLLMTAMDIRDQLMRRRRTKRELNTYVPTDREAMAELVNVTHMELMKVLTEISIYIQDNITN